MLERALILEHKYKTPEEYTSLLDFVMSYFEQVIFNNSFITMYCLNFLEIRSFLR